MGTFASSPAHQFGVGNVALVNPAAEAAEETFLSDGYASRAERGRTAGLLRLFAGSRFEKDSLAPPSSKLFWMDYILVVFFLYPEVGFSSFSAGRAFADEDQGIGRE